MDLSRFSAAPVSHLIGKSFEYINGFYSFEEGLHRGVIIAISFGTHRSFEPVFPQ